MAKKKSSLLGITLIEVIIVIAILTTLFGLVFGNILNVRSTTTISTSVTTLIADLKNQQIKSMAGDTEGRSSPDNYGIYISGPNYVLFHGQIYSASESANFDINADTGYQFTTTFPGNQVIFASGSGEIVNFTENQNTISVINTRTNEQKTIYINQYGVIVAE
jgi:type II secretory pathway pseudopilin PulG